MTSYRFNCENNHEFEAWFKDSKSYAMQAKQGFVTCPICDSTVHRKLPSSPNIGKKSNQNLPAPQTEAKEYAPNQTTNHTENLVEKSPQAPPKADHQQYHQWARKAHDYIEKNFKNVGEDFAKQARKIHYKQTNAANIYGTAKLEELEELHEEGIAYNILPNPHNKN